MGIDTWMDSVLTHINGWMRRAKHSLLNTILRLMSALRIFHLNRFSKLNKKLKTITQRISLTTWLAAKLQAGLSIFRLFLRLKQLTIGMMWLISPRFGLMVTTPLSLWENLSSIVTPLTSLQKWNRQLSTQETSVQASNCLWTGSYKQEFSLTQTLTAIVSEQTSNRFQLIVHWMVRFKTTKEMVLWMSMEISVTSLTTNLIHWVVQLLTLSMPLNNSLLRDKPKDNLTKIQVILILSSPEHCGLRSLRKKTEHIWLPRWQRAWVRLAMI